MLAQSLEAISLPGVVLLLFNIVIGAVLLFNQFSLRRLINQNDEQHRKLESDVAAEAAARHEDFRQLDGRVWEVNADLKENYPKRIESMRLYGTLVRRMEDTHRETMDELRRLPCTRALCPPVQGPERTRAGRGEPEGASA